MENQEIELRRFKQKAAGYRGAHELAPGARILEVLAIAGILEGFLRRNGLSRSEATVVDLMAGTGFLSEQLYQFGFRQIHALEACNEMSQDLPAHQMPKKHFKSHPFADIDGIVSLLRRIRPNVIVCLAGFHHLINYQADRKTVDVNASVLLQENMTRVCMEAIGHDGMLIIADIYDDQPQSVFSKQLPYWHRLKVFEKHLKRSPLPEAIKESLLHAGSFDGFSSTIEQNLCSYPKKQNPSLNWFRQVVGPLSAPGHKDIALNRQFLDRLKSMYRVSFASTACPWLFASQEILKKFLVTFWFDDISQDDKKVEEIIELAKKTNGISSNPAFSCFGWNLGFTIVESQNISSGAFSRASRRRLTNLFWILLILSALNIGLKLFTYWSSLNKVFEKLITLLLGIIIGEAMALWKRRTENRESQRTA